MPEIEGDEVAVSQPHDKGEVAALIFDGCVDVGSVCKPVSVGASALPDPVDIVIIGHDEPPIARFETGLPKPPPQNSTLQKGKAQWSLKTPMGLQFVPNTK
jgi:hypothetical protein